MFEFDLSDCKNISPQLDPNSTVITQEEAAEIIRLSETYSLSRQDQVKLLLLVRKLKKQDYSQSKQNEEII